VGKVTIRRCDDVVVVVNEEEVEVVEVAVVKV
jgi:hypothetical protein